MTPALQPIAWQTVRGTLWSWFRDVSGVETIWGNQAAPQPAYPYATLTLIAGTFAMGVRDEQRQQDDGSLKIVGQRDFGLSCQIHVGPPESTDGDCNALGRMHGVLSSFGVPEYRQRLADAGLALRERGQPQTLDLVIGTEWINRVQLDLRFGLASIVDTSTAPDLGKVGYFDKVEVSSDYQGLQGTGDALNLDNELLDPNA